MKRDYIKYFVGLAACSLLGLMIRIWERRWMR